MDRQVEVGKVYRHFKGRYYFVESIVYHSETQLPLVLYRPLYDTGCDKKAWVRPLDMFLEKCEDGRPDNVTNQTYRFELVEELSK